ncbi:MAG: 3-deoxy-8-phosphooctulonate synthase [Gemmatimonadetes bacterium]|nr:3-deoxy-8-phosphooctulonate synthase [Gemmatimonadota bacterium]
MTVSWLPPPILVAGPCALEDDRLNLTVGETLAELQAKLGLRVLYKGSFDKANRSSPDAPRGPGMEAGLARLERVRAETGLPVITDVHEAQQVEAASQVVDALQIPAFLCRQTDLLSAAGQTGKPVNIKKGQWMSPEAMRGAALKVRAAGGGAVALTERGTFFGYGDLVVDMRSFTSLKAATGCPVLFDATHAVQQPGQGPGGISGGQRQHVEALLLAAAAAGADGFFLETHPRPEEAPSDGATMWPLAELERLVERALDVWHASRQSPAPKLM